MNSSYLLVAYDETKDMIPDNAFRKYITEAEFKMLMEDFFRSIDLNLIAYEITGKRSMQVSLVGCVLLIMVIDVKKVL